MERQSDKKPGRSLNLKGIFRCMMESGYYPIYEKTHIVFGLDDNLATVEYEEGILAVRLFFSIEKDTYPLFLEAANETMMKEYMVRPVVLDEMKNLMFSCETMCDNLREFRKFFPRSIGLLREALSRHRKEMKRLLLACELASKTVPATDEWTPVAGTTKSHKVVS